MENWHLGIRSWLCLMSLLVKAMLSVPVILDIQSLCLVYGYCHDRNNAAFKYLAVSTILTSEVMICFKLQDMRFADLKWLLSALQKN